MKDCIHLNLSTRKNLGHVGGGMHGGAKIT
jgi:hypothetical protein